MRSIVIDRRQMLAALAATGIGTPVFHRALVSLLQEQADEKEAKVSVEMIKTAEWISGTEFDEEERAAIAKSLGDSAENWEKLRKHKLAFDDLPAMHFRPLADPPRESVPIERAPPLTEASPPQMPQHRDDIAFLPVTELSALIKSRTISSVELTKLYLERLKKYNELLNCVVTTTDELALQQAAKADSEIAAGRYRGPLHGIPWGAKDLIAVPGYPTSWGIPQFEQRELDQYATVARRLEQAGAVLVAKLSLGAIAMGDRWFRGMTRSPWNYKIGSSGSSAGSASATVAGLVGFSLGSETLGSIVSPCRRCGATGLRPTYGRVSRYGCMPLAWTMDKVGPITRSVEDCALVFAAIHGYDGLDPTTHDWPFHWPKAVDLSALRVGYTRRRRRSNGNDQEDDEQTERDDLTTLQALGCQVIEIELPSAKDEWVLAETIDVEAASVFDDMLRARDTDGWNRWPGIFRAAQFMTAIDFLRLQRRRRQLMFEMEQLMRSVDVLVNTQDLLIANLTGHPAVVIPQGFRERDGRKVPYSTVFTGRLYEDDRLLALAHAYQNSITAQLDRPPLDELIEAKVVDEKEAAEKAKQAETAGESDSDKNNQNNGKGKSGKQGDGR